GLAAALSGDLGVARDAFREQLELCREAIYRPHACTGLLGFAALASVDGDLDRAARLVGAAETHSFGVPKDAVDVRLDETFFIPARKAFGAGAWDQASREGAALGFHDAIAYALQPA